MFNIFDKAKFRSELKMWFRSCPKKWTTVHTEPATSEIIDHFQITIIFPKSSQNDPSCKIAVANVHKRYLFWVLPWMLTASSCTLTGIWKLGKTLSNTPFKQSSFLIRDDADVKLKTKVLPGENSLMASSHQKFDPSCCISTIPKSCM